MATIGHGNKMVLSKEIAKFFDWLLTDFADYQNSETPPARHVHRFVVRKIRRAMDALRELNRAIGDHATTRAAERLIFKNRLKLYWRGLAVQGMWTRDISVSKLLKSYAQAQLCMASIIALRLTSESRWKFLADRLSKQHNVYMPWRTIQVSVLNFEKKLARSNGRVDEELNEHALTIYEDYKREKCRSGRFSGIPKREEKELLLLLYDYTRTVLGRRRQSARFSGHASSRR